jgi:hypothetical protein
VPVRKAVVQRRVPCLVAGVAILRNNAQSRRAPILISTYHGGAHPQRSFGEAFVPVLARDGQDRLARLVFGRVRVEPPCGRDGYLVTGTEPERDGDGKANGILQGYVGEHLPAFLSPPAAGSAGTCGRCCPNVPPPNGRQASIRRPYPPRSPYQKAFEVSFKLPKPDWANASKCH